MQSNQVWGVTYLNIDKYASEMIACGPSFAMIADKEVWGCAGVCEFEPHRATAWALIHEQIGPRFFQFHKAVLSFLNECKYQRVEMVTVDKFVKAEQWAKMLGFHWEGAMEKYFPDGGLGNLYARVK